MRNAARGLAIAIALLPLAPARATADDAAILAAAAKRWAAAAELHKQLDKLLAAERDSVLKLIEEVGFTQEVRALAAVVAPPSVDSVVARSPVADAAEAGRKLSGWRRSWGPKWGKLVKLAGQLRRNDFAHRFARLALLRDPDQPDARALLGHVKLQGEWLGPLAVAKARAGQVWSPEVGWVAKGDLPRIAEDELPFEGRWLPTAEVVATRARWEHAWTFETDGWRVRTNVSPAEWPRIVELLRDAVALAREHFGHLFVFEPERITAALIFSAPAEYRAHVDGVHDGDPTFRNMGGFYDAKDHSLHVAWGSFRAGDSLALVVHEGLHAMLGESKEVDGTPLSGRGDGGFMEEVVAILVEELSAAAVAGTPSEYSVWPIAPAMSLAGAGRMSARDALAASPFSYPDQAKLYSTARAAARFLYGSPDPRRFEALKEYVALQHKNQAHPDLFPKLCGTTWEQLDAEWNAFCDELVKNPNHGKPEPLKWPK